VPNERYGSYLSTATLWFPVGQVVWIPQPLKVEQFFKMFKSAENWHILQVVKSLFLGHFFSKGCHS